MRRTIAITALLVVMAAVLAPMAQATIGAKSHACCLRQHHGAATMSALGSGDSGQHACCSAATLLTSAAPARAAGVKPLPTHPFITEFYPDADSSDSTPRQANRAPPTAVRSDR